MATLTDTRMTTLLTDQELDALAAHGQWPCVSLFQPTSRTHPDNRQDPIRLRNLLAQARSALTGSSDAGDDLLAPLESLQDDQDFWAHSATGLAILVAPGLLRIFRLERPVREAVVVADSFHTKPLRRLLQSADRYQVLALNLREARLYHGDRDGLDPLAVPGVPLTIVEALHGPAAVGAEGTDDRLGALSHGHGKDEFVNDTERFFRTLDRAVFEHCSRPSRVPLVLAALPEHHHRFLQVSHNPWLLAEAVGLNPFAASAEALRAGSWGVVQPGYRARVAGAVDAIAAARASGRSSDDLHAVARAVVDGRVATLLVEADRTIPARIDDAGNVHSADAGHPAIDDVLDDLAELAGRMGGQVLVLPRAEMPTGTGVAALFRY